MRDARVTAFVVEANRPGVSIGGYEHKLGIKGSPTGSPVFDDVGVPAENVVGESAAGCAAAQAVGIAQGATDYAVDYAKERIAFGKPIIELQGIQFKLADMQTSTAAARDLLYTACVRADQDPPPADLGMWTSMPSCSPQTTR